MKAVLRRSARQRRGVLAPAVRAAAAERYGIAAFAAVEALLASGLAVDAASVCVPTVHHVAAARPLLAAGLDLLIEKPLAASLAEADELRPGCGSL